MQYWEDDSATRVCLLSLDSIGNPRKFSRITRRLTRRKPVVVFAPGRTARSPHAGARGGLGHAPDEAVDALFRQAGVMVVHRRGAMVDVAKIAARQPLPVGAAGARDHQLGHAGPADGSHHRRGGAAPRQPSLRCSARSPIRPSSPQAARAALADPHYDSVLCAAVECLRQGHRGRDPRPGRGGGGHDQAAGRGVLGLPRAADERRGAGRARPAAPLRRRGRRDLRPVGAVGVRALAGPRSGRGADTRG